MSLEASWRRVAASAAVGFGAVLGAPHELVYSSSNAVVLAAAQAKIEPYVNSDTIYVPGKNMVSFAYVLRTGSIPSLSVGSQSIDWKANDSFIKTYKDLRQHIYEGIGKSKVAGDLLKLKSWTREDRAAWEREISRITSEELDKVKGLDKYRIAEPGKDYKGIVADRRALRLNDLSADIDNNTTTIEFDCEAMSAVEGCLLQETDAHFLPANTNGADTYKKASNYFYVNGWANWFRQSQKSEAHAYIVSSATGNIVEATADPSEGNGPSYRESIYPDFTFKAFVEGKIALSRDYSVYDGQLSFDQILKVRYDWALQEALAQTKRAEAAIKTAAADPVGAEMLEIMKQVAAKGFTDELCGRMSACLDKPGGEKQWQILAQEQGALLTAWNNVYLKTEGEAAYVNRVQTQLDAAMKSSAAAPCLPHTIQAVASFSFTWQLHVAEIKTERLWHAAAAFAADPAGQEICEIMKKAGKDPLSTADQARLRELLVKTDTAALWSAVTKGDAAMLKAWQDVHAVGGGENDTIRQICESLEREVKAMPEAMLSLPKDGDLRSAGNSINSWTSTYLKGLHKKLDADKKEEKKPDQKTEVKKVTLTAPVLTVPALVI